MGSVNLDNTGSGSAITLSSDGTSLLLDGTAVGGSPTLYAESLSGATSPTATGSNSVAIGSNAQATATNGSIAFGTSTTASGNSNAAIGFQCNAAGVGSLAIGYVANSAADFSTAIGRNAKTATGTNATALTQSYASGADSFAAAIANNTSTYGATGANSVVIGQTSKATDSGSVAIGKSCISDGGRTVALGHATTASGFYSFAVGALSEAKQTGSVCTGIRGRSDVEGKRVHSSSTFSAQIGNCQTGEVVLGKETSDATPTQMTSNPGNTPTATNSVTLPNNSAYAFTGTIVARQKASEGTASAAWKVEGLIRREANAGTTVLVASTVTALSNAPSWGMALTADTTNGCLKIEATGAASTNIRWVATINTSEVLYA